MGQVLIDEMAHPTSSHSSDPSTGGLAKMKSAKGFFDSILSKQHLIAAGIATAAGMLMGAEPMTIEAVGGTFLVTGGATIIGASAAGLLAEEVTIKGKYSLDIMRVVTAGAAGVAVLAVAGVSPMTLNTQNLMMGALIGLSDQASIYLTEKY